MFCKKCHAEIKDSSRFCSYCGNKIKEDETTSYDTYSNNSTSSTYEDPFKDYRIENNSHHDQYNYQTNYSNKVTTENDHGINNVSSYKSNFSLLAFLFIIAGIVSLFFKPLLAILFGFLALIFSIIGRKHTSKVFGNLVLVFSILAFISNLILGPTVYALNFEVSVAGEKMTILDYIKSAFMNGYNVDRLYGKFYSKEGYMLDLNSSYNSYYFYYDPNNTNTMYYYGYFEVECGMQSGAGEDIFEDDEYYFYTLVPSSAMYIDENGNKTTDTVLFNHSMVIKLSKKDKDQIILYKKAENITIELNRNNYAYNEELPTT